MQRLFRSFFLYSAVFSLFAVLGYSQDSQSIGDIARQTRQQKQSKDGQSKTAPAAKTTKVITNDEIPEHPETADQTSLSGSEGNAGTPSPSGAGGAKASAEQWKGMILGQKKLLSSLQTGIDKLNESIQFAPGNCVAGCVQWNERQKQKQQQVERMRSNLETQKKNLEHLQEQARQQGYGSSVYDP